MSTEKAAPLPTQPDEAVIRARIVDNRGLVYHVAKRFQDSGVDFDDLVGDGMTALVKAAQAYKDGPVPFGAYAAICIKRTLISTVSASADLFSTAHDHERVGYDDVAFAGDEGEGLPWSERIADPSPSPEAMLIAKDLREKRLRVIEATSPSLTDRERLIIQRRHLVDEDDAATLEELGAELGVTHRRVKAIETAAMKKIRKALTVID